MTKPKYIIVLDSGTTSVRSIVFDQLGQVVAIDQKELQQSYPQSGWVEHDPNEIWNQQLTTLQTVQNQAGIKLDQLAAIGITNQRETIVLWDKSTGLPVYNAIVWQDRRTADYCETLNNHIASVQQKTGLIINPYFSATKIKWILENVPAAQQALANKQLLAGTIDTWLTWKLTDGKVFVTDVSNASRTMLFNINTLSWDPSLLELFQIPPEILPKVLTSSEIYGYVANHHFSLQAQGKVPIASMVGDQQAALFGQLCFNPGMLKNTYGTGCFTLMNIGSKPIFSKNQLVTTVAWKIKNETTYALEGSVFTTGAAIQWIRDGLRLIYNAAESDFYAGLATKSVNSHQVYLVPAFTGLGAPHWDSYARGAIFGLERSTKIEHIVQATLESIAYQSNDLIQAMVQDTNQQITAIQVDGGASQSNYLMQFQADISQVEVIRPANVEATALGAFYLAALAVGLLADFKTIEQLPKQVKVFEPTMALATSKKLVQGWHEAVRRALEWKKAVPN